MQITNNKTTTIERRQVTAFLDASMIAATHSEDGSPLGRRYLRQWSRRKTWGATSGVASVGGKGVVVKSELTPAEVDDVAMEDGGVEVSIPSEFWEFFPSPPTDLAPVASVTSGVSELYVSDSTLVWSANGHVRKVFQGESQIKAAFVTSFFSYPKRPSVVINSEDQLDDQEHLGDSSNAICILEEDTMRIYYDNGEDFLVAIPFQVKAVWPTKYGILFETKPKASGNNFGEDPVSPAWFCLLHPLDDFTRVAIKHKGLVREQTADPFVIVFVSKTPSLCLAYHKQTGQHHVFQIRRSTPEESTEVESSISSAMAASGLITGTINATPSRMFSKSQLFSPTGHSQPGTPSGSYTASSSSNPFGGLSSHRTSAISPRSTLANICRSPASSVPATPRVSFHVARGMPIQSTTAASHLPFMQASEIHETESPDISLTFLHVWSEPIAISRQNGSRMSSKAFLAKDTLGDMNICYMQKQTQQLAVVRLESTNSVGLYLGAVNHIPAVDAIAVDSLCMTLVLDPTKQGLTLYSGLVKMVRVMFNTNPSNIAQMAHIAHEISALNLDSKPGTPLAMASASNNGRSRIMTSSRPPSALDAAYFNESLTMLSPVPQIDPEQKVTKLVSSICNQVTLQFANGMDLRIFLPSLSSNPLVNACLEAVCTALPKDLAAHFHAKWFSCRNAPGPACINPTREWKLFTQCLLGLLGYQTDHFILYPMDSDHSTTSPGASKKLRKSDSGSDGDWDFLLASVHHQEAGSLLSSLLGLEAVGRTRPFNEADGNGDITLDAAAILFASIPQIFMNLHTLYEEMKLDKCMFEHLQYLAGLLVRLSADLNLPLYVRHYWNDVPLICPPTVAEAQTNQMTQNLLQMLKIFQVLPSSPPNIYTFLLSILQHTSPADSSFPLNSKIAKRARDLTYCYRILAGHSDIKKDISVKDELDQLPRWIFESQTSCKYEVLVRVLTLIKYNKRKLETLPAVLVLPIHMALHKCRLQPTNKFDREAYLLIGRDDLAHHLSTSSKEAGLIPGKSEDGMEDMDASSIGKLRWPKDKRLTEVRRMLQSSSPVPIIVTQRPEVSDHDFVEEQERCLQGLCVRTMSLPVGRGAFTLFTASALVTDAMPIPRLCLSGRAPPRGTTVEMEHIDVVPNMERWSLFHNGVAAGLRMSHKVLGIDSTWIIFNKPKEAQNPNNPNSLIEHAGFLMALGLAGHLSKLGKLESFDYMMKGHEMIAIGVLLGIASSKRGSMDILATKKVSTQLVALLPPSATELPLSQVTQIAALISLGLLYEGTGHRHMAEVCLGELGRPPGAEIENCTDRESYSLSAGLALGMITFGQGTQLTTGALADLALPDLLYYHMIGGPRSALGHKAISSLQSQSFQVKEGDAINIDVTGPGATMALGMMFFDSCNEAIADWMLAPKTQFLLEFVRPEFLMLRTMARGLILWRDIRPSIEWIESNVPDAILPYCLVRPSESHPQGIDYETINQAYCNIISGAALILGIRFAGSHNKQAFETLSSLTHRLIAISKRSVSELAGRATIEQAVCVHVLALAAVMSGSGDLDVVRIIRYLRSRVGPKHSTVTYGSHMALHLALGLLFLGGGKLTLCTSPRAIAAMICAFYPKFPTHSNDNRYHLQALRHFYVLATEPRLLAPKDVTTLSHAYANFSVEFAETVWYPRYTINMRAPVILPELKYISSITLCDERYHGFKFCANNMEDLRRLLSDSGGVVMIKQKAGCLPYDQDPLGYRSLTASSGALSNKSAPSSFQWCSSSGSGRLVGGNFSSDPKVRAFSNIFLQQRPHHSEFKKVLNSILYECASHEKMELLTFWIEVFHAIQSSSQSEQKKKLSIIAGNGPAWNQNVSTFLSMVQKGIENGYICSEISSSVLQSVVNILNTWREVNGVDFSNGNEISKIASILALLPGDGHYFKNLKKNPLQGIEDVTFDIPYKH